MNLGEAIRTGASEIYHHKTRSFLSFFAIAIGVSAILYTLTQIQTMSVRFKKAIELVGPGRMEIKKKRNYVSQGLSTGLILDDALAIAREIPEMYMVSPRVTRWGTKFFHRYFTEKNAMILGITPEWRKRDWVFTLRGRFINQHDVDNCARVCVIAEPGGWAGKKPFWARWFRKTPFGEYVLHHDLLGQTVRIEDHLFDVVGILKNPPHDRDPRWFSRGWGEPIYVPITTYQQFLFPRWGGKNTSSIDEIQVDTGDERLVPSIKRRMEQLLKVRHRGEEDYEITDFRETVQGILNQTRQYAMAVLAVGIVAMLAGGIGIMNVTLATMFSRIKEIGIRRALGATKSDILLQFVTEAMMLGFCGGVAGVGLGWAGIHFLLQKAQRGEVIAIPWWTPVLSLGIAVATGFLFSIYPAYQASKLDPVEALRYE